MREILFRGKSIKTGDWIEGSLLKVAAPHAIYHLIFGPKFAFTAFGAKSLNHSAVDPFTIGQYTGMKDRNGKMIFEGDIISARLDEVFPEEKTLVFVEWIDGRWAVRYIDSPDGDYDDFDFFDTFTIDGFTIVGNIHDNPELLSGVKTND